MGLGAKKRWFSRSRRPKEDRRRFALVRFGQVGKEALGVMIGALLPFVGLPFVLASVLWGDQSMPLLADAFGLDARILDVIGASLGALLGGGLVLALVHRRLQRAFHSWLPAGHATIRADGILWSWEEKPWVVIPFRDLLGVSYGEGEVQLEYRDGSVHSLYSWDARELGAAIEAGLAAYGARAPTEIPALEFKTDLVGWIARAKSIAGAADYRGRAVTVATLEEVACDPRAAPAQRVGAALALGSDVDDERRVRVRVAIDDVADPELASAMRAALVDELVVADLHSLAESERSVGGIAKAISKKS